LHVAGSVFQLLSDLDKLLQEPGIVWAMFSTGSVVRMPATTSLALGIDEIVTLDLSFRGVACASWQRRWRLSIAHMPNTIVWILTAVPRS